jgi:hypothetical protein
MVSGTAPDFYALLQVAPDASPAEIEAAYRHHLAVYDRRGRLDRWVVNEYQPC